VDDMESTLPALPVGSWSVKTLRSKRPLGAQEDGARVKSSGGLSGEGKGDMSGVRAGVVRGTAEVMLRRKSADGMMRDRDIVIVQERKEPVCMLETETRCKLRPVVSIHHGGYQDG
jgi:hypothetical protein